MPEVVQAKCPHCQNVLRIPAEWIHQPMRCKHCQKVFQARPKPGAPAAARPTPAKAVPASTPLPPTQKPRAAAPVAAPATGDGNPFDFNAPAPAARRAPTPHRPTGPGRGWWKGAVLAGGVLLLAVVLGFVIGPNLAGLFRSDDPDKGKGKDGSAQVAPKDKDPAKDRALVPVPDGANKDDTGKAKDDSKKVDPPKDDNPKAKDDKKKDDAGAKKDGGTKKSDDTKKQDEGKKTGDLAKKPDPPPKKVPPGEVFPRRALLVSVNEYLLANPLTYGAAAGSARPASTGALKRALTLPPFHFPATQVYELSDRADTPHPPLKPVIEKTIADFLNSSREQDRVLLLFAGHVVEVEPEEKGKGKAEAYLVPIEGDLGKPETLIPLTWVYDRLRECKARQKVLVLDVCRDDPVRGNERPGGSAMGKVLDAMLQAPPAGVQVWSSCSPEQLSVETNNGSLFLQGLCAARDKLRLTGITEAGSALPVAPLATLVNQQIETALAGNKQKLKQATRVSGVEAAGGAPPNPEEPRPPQLVFLPPPPPPGGAADKAEVERILAELNRIPATRSGRRAAQDTKLSVTALPAFPAKEMAEYKADMDMATDFTTKDMAEKHPLRAAVQNAVKSLQENAKKFTMRESFAGGATAKVKALIKSEQELPGKAELYLREALDELKAAEKARDKETSKRWLAHYDYTTARLLARLVYIKEYNFALAQIRSDSLPDDDAKQGFTLGTKEKVGVTEGEVKTWVKTLRGKWNKIVEDYPNTPWAVMAQRERMTALGLERRAPTKE